MILCVCKGKTLLSNVEMPSVDINLVCAGEGERERERERERCMYQQLAKVCTWL